MILRWFDYRFVKQGSTDPNKRWVTVFGNDADWEKIWIPDVYLINEIPQGLLDAAPTDSIRIYENGTVKMTKRFVKRTRNPPKLNTFWFGLDNLYFKYMKIYKKGVLKNLGRSI